MAVAVIAVAGIGLFALLGGDDNEPSLFGIIEGGDNGIRAARFGDQPMSAVESVQRHRLDELTGILRFPRSGEPTVESFVSVGDRVGFIAGSNGKYELRVASLQDRQAETWFTFSGSPSRVSFHQRTSTFYVNDFTSDRTTCFSVKDGQERRAGRGLCALGANDELVQIRNEGSTTTVTRLTLELNDIDSFRVPERISLSEISSAGKLLYGRNENGEWTVISNTGEIVWEAPATSLSSPVLALSDGLRTVIFGVDAGADTGRPEWERTAVAHRGRWRCPRIGAEFSRAVRCRGRRCRGAFGGTHYRAIPCGGQWSRGVGFGSPQRNG